MKSLEARQALGWQSKIANLKLKIDISWPVHFSNSQNQLEKGAAVTFAKSVRLSHQPVATQEQNWIMNIRQYSQLKYLRRKCLNSF
ncbi:MAG: hypothetical protein OHK0037_34320 [Elainellaceae cyanobacterium]